MMDVFLLFILLVGSFVLFVNALVSEGNKVSKRHEEKEEEDNNEDV